MDLIGFYRVIFVVSCMINNIQYTKKKNKNKNICEGTKHAAKEVADGIAQS